MTISDFNMAVICDHTIIDPDLQIQSQTNMCSRCGNSVFFLDYLIDDSGNPRMMTDQFKPQLDVYRVQLTEKGQNKFDLEYGIVNNNHIGQKLTTTLSNKVKRDLMQGVEHVIALQEEETYAPYLDRSQTITAVSGATITSIQDTTIVARVDYKIGDGIQKNTLIAFDRT